jgi:hypothetical protein
MKTYRVVLEFPAKDKDEALRFAQDNFTSHNSIYIKKVGRVLGKRNPKPNPNQLNMDLCNCSPDGNHICSMCREKQNDNSGA